MRLAQIIVISVMVGAIAAGLTWFGWDLCQNLRVVVRKVAARRKPREEAAAQNKLEAAEAEVRSEAKGQR